ncbi:hypothetical protein BST40_28750, partial [Mycobacterium persicum]
MAALPAGTTIADPSCGAAITTTTGNRAITGRATSPTIAAVAERSGLATVTALTSETCATGACPAGAAVAAVANQHSTLTAGTTVTGSLGRGSTCSAVAAVAEESGCSAVTTATAVAAA